MRQVPQPLLLSAGLAAALLVGSLLLAPPLARMTDASAQTLSAAAAPRVSFDTSVSHDFVQEGEGVVKVALPRSALPAEVVVWFEGAASGSVATIRVFDPTGRLVVETATNGAAPVQVGLKSDERAAPPAVLEGGEWRVEFAGSTAGMGHARFHTL